MTSRRRTIGLPLPFRRGAAHAASQDNRAVALLCAGAGLFVHPCREDKTPLTRWRDRSTRDQTTVEELWRLWPDALPAIDCGKSGLLVVDADRHGGPDGVAAFQELIRDNSPIDAPAVETAGNGRHFYFRNPEGLKSSTSRLAPAVDVRGAGGYVIAPGATLADGRGWRASGEMSDFIEAVRGNRLPRLPRWLIAALKAPVTNKDAANEGNDGASFEATRLFKGDIDVLRAAVDAIPHDERIDMNTWVAVDFR